ncbi:MAG TPA: 23S rRNA (pseudouridine(1915)-N(3))-methyltransferase RlmH [Acidimicrobiales bacterium]
MEVVVAAVGRAGSGLLAPALEDYRARAARYWPLAVREVKPEPGRSLPAAEVRDREWGRLRRVVGDGGDLVACDEGGDRLSSEAFARWLRERREAGTTVTFLVGGASGLAADALSACGRRLSLAPWTLPHELARLVLLEQLYRAGTILAGEPYHR